MNKSNITIETQNYQSKNYDYIYKIKKSLYADYVIENYGKWEENKQIEFFETYINNNKNHIYIIISNKQNIGFLDYQVNNKMVEINNICIDKKHQGKGIGTYILKNIINSNLDKTISLQVFIQNKKAINLYTKLGFKIIQSSKTHHTMLLEKTPNKQ